MHADKLTVIAESPGYPVRMFLGLGYDHNYQSHYFFVLQVRGQTVTTKHLGQDRDHALDRYSDLLEASGDRHNPKPR